MKFCQAVESFLKNRFEDLKEGFISDYLIGIKYSYAIFSSQNTKSVGLSFVPREDIIGCPIANEPKIDKISSLMKSKNILDRILAVAVLNAVSQYLIWNVDKLEAEKVNLIDKVCEVVDGSEKVVVIGNMIPLVRKIKGIAREVLVFERNPNYRTQALPDCLEFEFIEDADILIMTGATLVNGTFDAINKLSNPKLKIIVGPTAQAHPDIFKELGINLVCSLKVVDCDETLSIIKRGGGRWTFSDCCEEYCFSLK